MVGRSRIAVLAVVTALLAGCGGSTSSTSATTCLEKAGATVKETKVTPTFQSTGVEHALVEQLAGQNNGKLPVQRKGNVLVSWLTASTEADVELIDRCL